MIVEDNKKDYEIRNIIINYIEKIIKYSINSKTIVFNYNIAFLLENVPKLPENLVFIFEHGDISRPYGAYYKKNNKDIICIQFLPKEELNSNFNSQLKNYFTDDVKDVLYHELVHYLDEKRIKNFGKNNSKHIIDSDYYNSNEEKNAFTQNIINIIHKTKEDKILFKKLNGGNFNSLIKNIITKNDTFNNFYNNLTLQNKKKLLKRLYGAWSHINENIKNNHISYNYGQHDFRLSYYDGDKEIGYINYSEFNNIPYIKMIEVYDGNKRKGIARQLVLYLQQLYPEKEIEIGTLTTDGENLFNNIPSKKVKTKFYKYFEVYDKIIKNIEYLDENFEKLSKDKENLIDKYNKLNDLEYKLRNFLNNKDKFYRIFY